MSILNEEQTKEILDGAIEQIKQAVVNQATRQAAWQCEQTLHQEVDAIIQKFVEEEVAPEIVTSLKAKRSQIIEAAIVAAEEMAEMLAVTMTTELSERLGDSYRRKKIFEAMFGC